MSEPATALMDPVQSPICSLAVHLRRVAGSVVGRPTELAAIQQEMESARGTLASVTLEGEPGIGKTRLLVAAAELASAQGFTTIAVTADEEIRGPFLLARSIFASPSLQEAAAGTGAEAAVLRIEDAVAGRDEPGLEGLSADRKLLRTFDLAAVALGAVASVRPLALLLDDLQWADEDTLRMLRYVVRADAGSPIFVLLAIRPDEMALVNEAVTLVADMERMGLVRRLKLSRFSPVETRAFLHQLLGGQIDPSGAVAMHAQSEGVPFIAEELVHAYRETAMIQQIDGVWTLARNADRLVPSAVRTLIQRRVTRVPEETKASLAQAAVLGRSFSLRDLAAVKDVLNEEDTDAVGLAEALAPAVRVGLLLEHPQDAPADYTFTHEQVRESAAAWLSPPRRRAVHAAIVTIVERGGEPPAASLPLLARHSLAAGDAERAARYSASAAMAALNARAPEEALRLVEEALPTAAAAQDRRTLLCARDEALDMLRRPEDRLEVLAELAALAEAMGDGHFELDVMLRRAAALRLAGDHDIAAEMARRVRTMAAEREDRRAELQACLELGQALLRTSIGEGYVPGSTEADVDGAEEPFERAAELAEDLGDQSMLAATIRELGVIDLARVRAWFVERVMAGEHVPILQMVAAGGRPEDILPDLPIGPVASRARERFERALDLFERAGDRRGAMSAIIALAYLSFGPDIHIGPTPARRIEEIRRLATQMESLTKESERSVAEAQMLYGVHVFARAKVIPDLAVARGLEAHQRARLTGDRSLEFVCAGGIALAYLDMGDVEEAERWLGRASAAAAVAPTPLRVRQIELWRGMVRGGAGDVTGMREHLERAVRLATDQGSAAGRCEALARTAELSARLGAERQDEELLAAAESAAADARQLMAVLPGHPPWGALAEASLAQVALARGDETGAAAHGRAALAELEAALREDGDLDVLLPASRAVLAGGSDEERRKVRDRLQLALGLIAQRTLDEEARVRWFRGPVGRELVELAGPLEPTTPVPDGNGRAAAGLGEADALLLRLLSEGRTNQEIAEQLAITEQVLTRRLGEMFAKIGASSRAEATAFAFREGVL